MAIVKFTHSVKYNGVFYDAHVPFEAKEMDIALLQTQGAIILSNVKTQPVVEEKVVSKQEEKKDDEKEDINALKSKLITYTAQQLVDFAKSRDINLKGASKKSEIFNIILESLEG